MHAMDEPEAAAAPGGRPLALAAAASAAAAVGRGDGARVALPPAAAAAALLDTEPASSTPSRGAPAPPDSLALAPFVLAGPLLLCLTHPGPLALRLPRHVDVPHATSVAVPDGAAVRVVGAARATLASALDLGAPSPAWLAAAYGEPVAGVAPGAPVSPGAGALAAAAGARRGASDEPPAVDLDLASPGARLELASLDGSPVRPLRARAMGEGRVELVPRGGSEVEAEAGDADADAAPLAPAWAWPLVDLTGPSLARVDAALAELVAAARAARADTRAPPAAPRLRLQKAGAEAVAFVRVKFDVTRTIGGGEEEGSVVAAPGAASAAAVAAAPTTHRESWEALVRVAPPDAPGGPPRLAALRAERLPGVGVAAGGGRVVSVSLGARAFLAAARNATLPEAGGHEFVYPPAGLAGLA